MQNWLQKEDETLSIKKIIKALFYELFGFVGTISADFFITIPLYRNFYRSWVQSREKASKFECQNYRTT